DASQDADVVAETERRFKRELLLARKVTHPNVVRIHDLGEIDGIKYITMPYIEGTDLAHVLSERGTLPVSEALPIARQTIAGLNAAHQAGVVHRDLKPANIMIDGEGNALIMDFGIARGATTPDVSGSGRAARVTVHAGETQLGTTVGTIEYMAPEQARGAQVDHRADIYAFGLIVSRMLVGKRLAEGASNVLEDLQARLKEPPVALRTIDPAIPEAVERIVTRCVQPDAAARYATTEELLNDLNDLDDQGVPLPKPPHFLSSWRFRLGATAAFVLIVAATWYTGLLFRPAAPVQHDPVSVVIADFQNSTNDATFDHMLEPVLKLALEGAGFISAYDRSGLARILDDKPPEKLDEQAALELAVKQGLGVVLSGSLERQGSGYGISVKVTRPV